MPRHAETFIYNFKGFVRGTYSSTRNYEIDYLRQIFHEIYMTRDGDDILMHRMIPVFKGPMINEDMVATWKEKIFFNYMFTRVDLDEVGPDPPIEVVIPPPVANIDGRVTDGFFAVYPRINLVATQTEKGIHSGVRAPRALSAACKKKLTDRDLRWMQIKKNDSLVLSFAIGMNPVFWLWIFIAHGVESIDPYFLILSVMPILFVIASPSFNFSVSGVRTKDIEENGVREREFKTRYTIFVLIELACFGTVLLLHQYMISAVMVVVFSIQLVRLTTRFFSRPGEIALLMSLALNPLLWRLFTSVVGGGLAWLFSYAAALYHAKIHNNVGSLRKRIAAAVVLLEAFSSIGFTYFYMDLTVVSLVLAPPLLAASMLLVLEPGWKTGLAAAVASFCTHPVLWYYIGIKDILLLLVMMVISIACLQIGNTLCPRGSRLRIGLGLASLSNGALYLLNATSQMMGILVIVPIAISIYLFGNPRYVDASRSPRKEDGGKSKEILYRSP